MDFLRAGGVPMIVVILFSGATLIAAIRFALRPVARKLAGIRALTWASTFAVLSGTAANLAMVCWRVSHVPEWSAAPVLPVLAGVGESLTLAILGFSVLATAWLLVAVGSRRLDEPS
jgi:hypothetical protein